MVEAIKKERHVHLSVVVPAFNCQNTIEECLVAIRRSTFPDYELIVADDGSSDRTAVIAKQYADKLVLLPHAGRISARKNGLKVAEGQILVNIDSDVLIKKDTLTRINEFFEAHPEVDALTGCLSKNTPAQNFFSQYKNLYMHHIFSKLPERVTFLYGLIYAVRAEQHHSNPAMKGIPPVVKIADDTALGQSLAAAGRPIAFLKDLQVTHLKKFTLVSFFKNDFDIPFEWAKIFLCHRGWRQIGKGGTGYCHSPIEQLASVVLAPLTLILFTLTTVGRVPMGAPLCLAVLWCLLNIRYLIFLDREKGPAFALRATLVTFLDHNVMAAGIACGSVAFIFDHNKKKEMSV